MENLQVFKYENNDVRTMEMNGEAWFVLKDVCGALGGEQQPYGCRQT